MRKIGEIFVSQIEIRGNFLLLCIFCNSESIVEIVHWRHGASTGREGCNIMTDPNMHYRTIEDAADTEYPIP